MYPQTISVLIVDDDPVFARFAQQLVLALGHDLPCSPSWVDTAEKALDAIRANRHDLVLLDYQLPGADGLSLLSSIQQFPADHRPAVIMLTASGSEAVAVEAMKRGAKDYLAKANLDLPPLLRALRSSLAQKRLAEKVAAYDAQVQADLTMARSLQQSLLPDSYPAFPRSAPPDHSALRFCHRFLPATQLAGDFFSILPLSDFQAGVFICDVMGHGVQSALITAMLRTLLDEMAPRFPDPGLLLAEMNRKLRHILRHNENPLFVTAFYLLADLAARQFRFANAAHPSPLHLNRATGEVLNLTNLPNTGSALGLFPDSSYPTSQLPLASGDLLLFFTDGLFEVVDATSDQDYTQERLLAAVRRRVSLPLDSLCDQLIAEVRAFSGSSEFEDDVCLLAMEVTP